MPTAMPTAEPTMSTEAIVGVTAGATIGIVALAGAIIFIGVSFHRRRKNLPKNSPAGEPFLVAATSSDQEHGVAEADVDEKQSELFASDDFDIDDPIEVLVREHSRGKDGYRSDL